MPVGTYLRVSTEEQRERQSIATQRDFAERYCDLHQLSVIRMYADDGVSGTVPLDQRPEGSRILQDARLQKFDQILVYRLDRLGRDTRLILNAVAELEKCGVRVRSMTEEFDTATATGRLMLTMLSGFAAHERDVIRERSVAGTNRLAEKGVWLGGVVPFGYRAKGQRGQRRLVISDAPIPGIELSEAGIVCDLYRLCAQERKSCQAIADLYNQTGVPCRSIVSEEEPAAEGKRARRVATFWRPAHIRRLIATRTYMGEHLFGKRSKDRERKVISREVPAIVSPETWYAAQAVMKVNRIMSQRTNAEPYLLRGLIRCGLCGLMYSGSRARSPKPDHYYRCNGRQFAHAIHGSAGKKCAAKNLVGAQVDRLIWQDIEAFLRDPEALLQKLRDTIRAEAGGRRKRQKELKALNSRLDQKTAERERILALYRRGRIDDATLDAQLNAIESEAAALRAEVDGAIGIISTKDRSAQLETVASQLAPLQPRLDGTITPELKRQLVETFVASIRVKTVERSGVPQREISVTYRFGSSGSSTGILLPVVHPLIARVDPVAPPITFADHLVQRRLSLGLSQREVAERMGVDKATIYNWESGRGKPNVGRMPAVIEFLGYNPSPPSDAWCEQLVGLRRTTGITQRELAARLCVDPTTFARWERGERTPPTAFVGRIMQLLGAIQSGN